MMKVTLIDTAAADENYPLGIVRSEEVEAILFTQAGYVDMLTSYGYHILVDSKNIISITAE